MPSQVGNASTLIPGLATALAIPVARAWGRLVSVEAWTARVAGLAGLARLGDRLEIDTGDRKVGAEIIAMEGAVAIAYAHERLTGAAPGEKAWLAEGRHIAPSEAWIGRVLDAFGREPDGAPAPPGGKARPLDSSPPPAPLRRGLGQRLASGFAVLDTFLPICTGQRIGLFAGSGVGKSTLLGALARDLEADVVVVALIGERGREVRHFLEDVLGAQGRARSIVIASTSDQSALVKKRGAQLALATAEHFRDEGRRVLLVFDSITRYADAHREVALAAGEPPSLHAYPPSTFREIAALAERAGPGAGSAGDITAVFSVLVAGSDMEEPVADIVRGVLDGHVVLSREIAERGRFPAIDVRRSLSRALPGCASDEEYSLLAKGRSILGVYEDAETIVRAGLYSSGSDPRVDAALALWPALDSFFSERTESPEAAFEALNAILSG